MSRTRTLITLVVALLLAATALQAGAQESGHESGFDDVPDGNVHSGSIAEGVELGLVQGVTATTFEPALPVTRGQAASLLFRVLDARGVELPPPAEGPAFPDIGPPHADAIRSLAAAEVIQGLPDGRYGPQMPVTRAQQASLLIRALAYATGTAVEPAGDSPFTDVTGGVHHDTIVAAFERELMVGRTAERFEPNGHTRRDQAASVAVRFYDHLADAGEVWVLDQGTDRIHVYDGEHDFSPVATIDVAPDTLEDAGFHRPNGAATVPHMIEFDSEDRYAFIAATAGGVTLIVDARTKEVVEVVPTGGGSHMAAVTPDDSAVWVAAIGAQAMVEIPLDLDAAEPTFAVGRTLDMAELLEPLEDANDWTYPSTSPVCHQYSVDSTEAWITLGPAWDAGALVVLDLDSGTLVADAAYDPGEVKANCGVSVTADRVLANWSGQVVDGDNTPGEWYVFDPDTYELTETRPANGFDTHGLRLTPDGSAYWQVNRISDDAMVIDAATLEVIVEYDDIARTPDIIDFSPDSTLVYISQRGPNPRSGAPHAATGDEPGVRVVDTATGETVAVLEQDEVRNAEDELLNDPHGVGVRSASPEDAPPAAE